MALASFHRHPNGILTGLGNFTLHSPTWGPSHALKSREQRLRGLAKQQSLSRDARRRLEWILWYETTGGGNARATCRHFGIAPKLFYFWKKRFSETILIHLEDRSHRPQRIRTSARTPSQEMHIIALRKDHLHYSKMKIACLYEEKYGYPISSWQVQKVIEKYSLYPNEKRAARIRVKRRNAWKKKRITELTKKPRTGFLFGIDTIVLWLETRKRYVYTAVDRHSRLAFARMYTSHSSAAAADFLRRLHLLMNGQMVHIQTDNGSEFQKHFAQAAKDLHLEQWFSRVKTPKDNAICERFNRTLQEEFLAWGYKYEDPVLFNGKLTEWLIEYDFRRPHAALGYRKPIEIACLDPKVLPIYSSRTLRACLKNLPPSCHEVRH